MTTDQQDMTGDKRNRDDYAVSDVCSYLEGRDTYNPQWKTWCFSFCYSLRSLLCTLRTYRFQWSS